LAGLRGFHGFLPSAGAETPFLSRGEGGEVVAAGICEVEEGLREGCCDGVVSGVGGVGAAESVAGETGAFGEET